MKKTYQTLFFDVDDTLLDFGAAEKSALRMVSGEENITLTPEMEKRYREINEILWRAYEDNKMSRDEVVNTRFSLLFKEYGLDVDGASLELKYRKHLENGHMLIAGAYELINRLHAQFDLYIVTNGISETQYKRLRASGLFPFFKDIFVSEDTGFQKPMKEFFDHVFARVPNFNPEQGMIIGDSLGADIRGGLNAGLDTCWFNPNDKANDLHLTPTYQIRQLGELYGILGVE